MPTKTYFPRFWMDMNWAVANQPTTNGNGSLAENPVEDFQVPQAAQGQCIPRRTQMSLLGKFSLHNSHGDARTPELQCWDWNYAECQNDIKQLHLFPPEKIGLFHFDLHGTFPSSLINADFETPFSTGQWKANCVFYGKEGFHCIWYRILLSLIWML